MNLNRETRTTGGISPELGWIFGLKMLGRMVLVGMLVSVVPAKGFAETIVAPDFLWNRGIAEKTDPVAIADTHLKIPYREDGALDHRGQFTTFTRPDVIFHDPGLNCSGLVLSICRFLFNKNWSLEEATRDRQQNSGAHSPLGKDWDFGWDLIVNLTEGHNPRVLMPDGGDYPIEKYNAETLRGFPLHDVAAWQAVMSRMRPGRVYLGSISKPANRPGYRLLHYHVVLIIPDTKGAIWLYHATQRSHAHRINIGSREGMRRFLAQFTGRRGEEKHILLVEATIPDFGDQQGATQASLTSPPVSGGEGSAAAEPGGSAAVDGARPADVPSSSVAEIPLGTGSSGQKPAANPPPQGGPELVINHLAGKVFKPVREVITHIPAFSDASRTGLRFWFQNASPHPKAVRIALKTPSGTCQYEGKIPGDAVNFIVQYPQDFGQQGGGPVRIGKYLSEINLEGNPWVVDVFEVALPREAQPKIVAVNAPANVRVGQTFTVKVQAENKGAESDYGGITVSCPDPSGLRIVGAKNGKVYPPGSTVLAITTDRIKTKVPMAERWIELWGENKEYDLEVQLRAGRPGRFPLYVRCALRGVNVKSSVVLMDPPTAQETDQQGFPVYVYYITVQ